MNKPESSPLFLSNLLNEGIYVIDEKEEKKHNQNYVSEGKENRVKESATPYKSVEFIGENKKSTAILVEYKDARWIIEKDKMVLQKILAAVNHDFNDIALINANQLQNSDVDQIIEELECKNIIGFDINKSFIKNMTTDKLQTIGNTKILFTSFNLTDIAMSKEKKRILWTNMKEMFDL